ncbi:ankyrin repeat domain 60 [Rhinolophus ferrumequinum]|uniref:Ankyrin repeat domain 60 n=1 Tax=Rhinolophus ferrumequinum TaxID=59479 RepID=A0A7J7S6L2_RHIFE|nr:ankyrin repeat domain 60 [Rhinolophus ferrumequinum]
MTRAGDRRWAMRQAVEDAAGAGGGRAARSPAGALRPDPAAGRRGGRGAGSAGPRPLAAQPSARTHSRPRVGDPQSASLALDLAPDVFVMRVLLEETSEVFRVTNCRGDMTVLELKEELDLIAGIPLNLQRLQYLDQGILMDDTTLKFHDVVPGGIISLHVWPYDGWTELVLAAAEGDPSKLSCLGVTEDSFYQTANSQHLKEKQWKKWISQRAFVALYIASHRGHLEAMHYLLEHGANCLGRTPVGRTPLHVAAAMGRWDCIKLLLKYGASINHKDAKGMTPMAISFHLNSKQSAQQYKMYKMFPLHWVRKSGRKGLTGMNATKAFPSVTSGSGSKKSKAELPLGPSSRQS